VTLYHGAHDAYTRIIFGASSDQRKLALAIENGLKYKHELEPTV